MQTQDPCDERSCSLLVYGHQFRDTDEGYWVGLKHLLSDPLAAAECWWPLPSVPRPRLRFAPST